MPRDRRAVGPRDLARAVARAVVDHQHGRGPVADDRGDPRDDGADVVLLVVGGDDHGDLVAEALRHPVGAELVPRDALERRGQLALDPPVLHLAAQHEHEQDGDREHREAEDPLPAAALEGEEPQERVGELGAGHEHQRETRQQHQQHVAVAQRAATRDGEHDDGHADGEAEDAEGTQLHESGGEDIGGFGVHRSCVRRCSRAEPPWEFGGRGSPGCGRRRAELPRREGRDIGGFRRPPLVCAPMFACRTPLGVRRSGFAWVRSSAGRTPASRGSGYRGVRRPPLVCAPMFACRTPLGVRRSGFAWVRSSAGRTPASRGSGYRGVRRPPLVCAPMFACRAPLGVRRSGFAWVRSSAGRTPASRGSGYRGVRRPPLVCAPMFACRTPLGVRRSGFAWVRSSAGRTPASRGPVSSGCRRRAAGCAPPARRPARAARPARRDRSAPARGAGPPTTAAPR